MSQETEVLYTGKSSDQPVESLSWFQTWILVLTRPSIGTFERIIRDPKASARRAYLWIFIAVIIGSIIQAAFALPGFMSDIISSTTQGSNALPGIAANPEGITPPFFSLICAPGKALLQILGFIVIVAIQQWIAGRAFGGSGTYASLAYATGAYLAPISIIGSLLSGFPSLICLSVAILIYTTLLGIMAVKAANRIGWGGAVVSFIGGYLVVVFVTAVLTICVLALLGPAVNDMFQNSYMKWEAAGVVL